VVGVDLEVVEDRRLGQVLADLVLLRLLEPQVEDADRAIAAPRGQERAAPVGLPGEAVGEELRLTKLSNEDVEVSRAGTSDAQVPHDLVTTVAERRARQPAIARYA